MDYIAPSFQLKSSKLTTIQRYFPLHFREELLFAIEGLPFYKPIIDKFACHLEPEYKYILSLPGDTRTKKLRSTIDNSEVTIPLVPATRFFDYFLPYLDRWEDDGEIIVDFTRDQLELVEEIVSLNYVSCINASKLFSFLCANEFAYQAYLDVVFPHDYDDVDMIDKLGQSIKKYDINSIAEKIPKYFSNFKELSDGLFYLTYKLIQLSEHDYFPCFLSITYCERRGVYKDAFRHLLFLYEENLSCNSRFSDMIIKAYENEIDNVLKENVVGRNKIIIDRRNIDITFPIISSVSGDDYYSDMRRIAIVAMIIQGDNRCVFSGLNIFSTLINGIPYQNIYMLPQTLKEVDGWSSYYIREVKQAMTNLMKHKELSNARKIIIKQIFLIIDTVEIKIENMNKIIDLSSDKEYR